MNYLEIGQPPILSYFYFVSSDLDSLGLQLTDLPMWEREQIIEVKVASLEEDMLISDFSLQKIDELVDACLRTV